jgi:hypothetical protein
VLTIKAHNVIRFENDLNHFMVALSVNSHKDGREISDRMIDFSYSIFIRGRYHSVTKAFVRLC